MRTPLRILLPALALGSLAVPGLGRANGEVTFTKVLDTDDRIPGEAEAFGRLYVDGSDPARRLVWAEPHVAMDDSGNIAFGAGRRLFAILDGRLESVTSDPMSGDLGQIQMEGGRVTWSMHDLGRTREGGIFRWEERTTIEIAGRHTPVPDGGGCVFWTKLDHGITSQPFGVDRDAVVFSGTVDDENLLPEVAALGPPTQRCAGGSFVWWKGAIHRIGGVRPDPLYTTRASIEGGLLAFDGYDGAIYRQKLGKAPRRLIGPGDRIPGGCRILARVGGATVAFGRITFWGSDEAGRKGVYLWDGGTVSTLVEEGTDLRGGRTLVRLDQWRLGPDRVAVQGADGEGRFTYVAPLEGGSYQVVPHAAGLGEFNGSQILLGNEWAPLSVIRSDGS
ncbi:MAG TPA: hypothetical protein VFG80_08325, partial [Myxococcota bacterium]|nr:hypothetical protein [Myxococcota bacterium]